MLLGCDPMVAVILFGAERGAGVGRVTAGDGDFKRRPAVDGSKQLGRGRACGPSSVTQRGVGGLATSVRASGEKRGENSNISGMPQGGRGTRVPITTKKTPISQAGQTPTDLAHTASARRQR